MQDKRIIILRIVVIISLISTVYVAHSQDDRTDTFWQQVYNKKCCGWTGGDGVYSIPLSDGRSIFIFGDTYLGEVKEDNSRDNTVPVIKNSLVIYNDGEIETLYDQTGNKPKPFFKTARPDSTWFWPGHGFELNGVIYFFLSEFHMSGSGMFGFEWIGTSIAHIDAGNFRKSMPSITKWEHKTDIHFGNATLINEDHLYVFGVRAFQVYVARTTLGAFDWEYLSNGSWVTDGTKSTSLDGVYCSEQFSVFMIQGRFVILTQGAMLGAEIYSYTSSELTGGWSKPKEIYKTREPALDSTLITYNALAHPQFIANDELLISYCVNSTDFPSIYRDVNRYRPRFIRIPLHLILE